MSKVFAIASCFCVCFANASESEKLEIMDVNQIKSVISECTEVVNESEYAFKQDLDEEKIDEFVDAMYSLEYLTFRESDSNAIDLYESLSSSPPFNHPEFLGEW